MGNILEYEKKDSTSSTSRAIGYTHIDVHTVNQNRIEVTNTKTSNNDEKSLAELAALTINKVKR